MAVQTQINGNRPAFQNIDITVNGADLPKGILQSLNYKWTQEPGVVQGNSIVMTGRTPGFGMGSGDMSMLVNDFDDMNADITDNGNVPTTSVDFLIVVSYSINDVDVRTDTLRGVRITDISFSNSKGTDPVMVSLTLSIPRISLNGIDCGGDLSA